MTTAKGSLFKDMPHEDQPHENRPHDDTMTGQAHPTTSLTRTGLIVAAVMNIGGVLVFSRLFTNVAITQADPGALSTFGLIMIVVWGFAYLGAAAAPTNIRWLAGAFAVEKLVYVVNWAVWMSRNSLAALYATDRFAGAFYSIYGLNDFVFLLFFSWIFISQRAKNHA